MTLFPDGDRPAAAGTGYGDTNDDARTGAYGELVEEWRPVTFPACRS